MVQRVDKRLVGGYIQCSSVVETCGDGDGGSIVDDGPVVGVSHGTEERGSSVIKSDGTGWRQRWTILTKVQKSIMETVIGVGENLIEHGAAIHVLEEEMDISILGGSSFSVGEMRTGVAG